MKEMKATEEPLPRVEIYTDGSCFRSVGGYAAIIIYKPEEHKMFGKEIKGHFVETTSNRMEMTAVIKALKRLNKKCQVDVFTDSKMIVDAFEKGWVEKWERKNFHGGKKLKNKELWEIMYREAGKHEIKFHWIKGHSGNKYNERCDYLSNCEAFDAYHKYFDDIVRKIGRIP